MNEIMWEATPLMKHGKAYREKSRIGVEWWMGKC